MQLQYPVILPMIAVDWTFPSVSLRVLLINGESIEHDVGPRVATITVYRYFAAGDVHNAEVIG